MSSTPPDETPVTHGELRQYLARIEALVTTAVSELDLERRAVKFHTDAARSYKQAAQDLSTELLALRQWRDRIDAQVKRHDEQLAEMGAHVG